MSRHSAFHAAFAAPSPAGGAVAVSPARLVGFALALALSAGCGIEASSDAPGGAAGDSALAGAGIDSAAAGAATNEQAGMAAATAGTAGEASGMAGGAAGETTAPRAGDGPLPGAAGEGGSPGNGASAGAAGDVGAAGQASAGAESEPIDAGGAGQEAGGSAGDSASAGDTGEEMESGGAGDPGEEMESGGAGQDGDGAMSFFVTSRGRDGGGDLGGLAGADAFCQTLAEAVGSVKTWRAYLSADAENARDRIGTGPWYNQAGVLVAESITALHDQAPGGALDATWPPADLSIALDENGGEVPNSVHDILTGSDETGAMVAGATCQDWTSSAASDTAQVGHSNRDGGGRPPSFSTTHTVGCAPSADNYAQGTVTQGGGRGSLYCFAL